MSKLVSMYEDYDRAELSYPGGPVEILDCDIAVVGGGGSGMNAAVRASELGARVIVVEKMERLGGNSWLAGGLLSTTSKYQRELGFADQTDHYIETAHKFHRYLLDPAIFERYLKNSGPYLEWLVDKGLDIQNTRWAMDGAVMMIKEPLEDGPLNNPAYGPGWSGTAVLTVLKQELEKRQVPVLMETKARSLITNGDGAVVGVRADGQERSCIIRAKAVVISAGNMAGNMDMLLRFYPQYFASDNYFSHYSLKSLTGDGIAMAEEIGAEVGRNMSLSVYLAHIPGSYTIQRLVNEPLGIIVNQNGKRFCCEDAVDDVEFVLDRQPEGLGYFLLDRPTLEEGFHLVLEHIRFGDRTPSWEEFWGDLDREAAEGKLAVADTLEGLAPYIGCAPAALRATVERCNGHCDAGRDDEFYKAPEHLRRLRTGPFYAIRLQRNFDVTMGGISINSHLQALRPDQSVIPGLYVTGDNASNWMGEEYGPMFSSFCWAMNSGYLAGEEAAAYVRQA